ncbi:MAG: hypothetical protein JWN08_3387 [Frankiales bacterium]|nr:hypothetical protein [Frankiales bacterium]
MTDSTGSPVQQSTAPREQEQDQDQELLLDRHLPAFVATTRQHLVVEADRSRTWAALERLDLMQVHSPLLDAAMTVRGLPSRFCALVGRGAPLPPPPQTLRLVDGAGPALPGWLALGTRPGHEVVLGAVGRFWRPDIVWYDVTAMTPDGFTSFLAPTWGRIAAGVSLLPYGRRRTLVTYEARTAVQDDASRRAFLRYWTVVRPFAGHVMRATLHALQDEAQRPDRTLALP